MKLAMLVALLFLLTDAVLPQPRLEQAFLDAVVVSCSKKVTIDRDLTRACQRFVDAVATGKSAPTGSAVTFYASLESSEPAPVARLVRVSPPSGVAGAMRGLFGNSCPFNRGGVAAALLGSDKALVCALTADHESDLAPIPGSVEEFDTVQISGRLAKGLSNPRLFVTRPTGEVEEKGLVSSGGEFTTRLTLPETGQYSLEILATGPGGPSVVALRRVFAGVKPPAAPPPEPELGKGLDGVEAAIARLRASRGLPKLERDPALDEIALGHSKEMARTQTFAHVLPTDGSMADRLAARDYPYKTAGENIGLAGDAPSAHEAIVGSPAHLANLLDPRHRKLGLGEARGPVAEGGEAVYLTELLAEPFVYSADPARDTARLVEDERRRKGLTALRRDKGLDQVAQREAADAARTGEARLTGNVAGMALETVPGLEGAVAELYVGGGPEVAARSKSLADKSMTRVGVGAVYAASKEFGARTLWVVLLYGR